MTRRAPVAIAIMTVAVGLGLWWVLRPPSEPVGWQGYVEGDYVKVAPVEAGLLTSVSVARGDVVEAGAPLFTQDETEERAARDQAARQLEQARLQLANLEAAGKQTEISQAQANLADAEAEQVRAQADFRRGQMLLPSRAVSVQSVDLARAQYQSATAKVHALQAALAQMRGPMGRADEIMAQQAAVDGAKAALDMAQWRLDQRRVAAPAAGRIADVLARPGETMGAGQPVVSLLPPENILIRFFVPETALATIHRGDRLTLDCDSCAGGLPATVSFVSPQAEYSPPVIYSEESRAKLVFLIEARPAPDAAKRLNPGQPVDVRPAVVGKS